MENSKILLTLYVTFTPSLLGKDRKCFSVWVERKTYFCVQRKMRNILYSPKKENIH